jgi:hypothetical protein
MNILLNSFQTFWDNLLIRLQMPVIIVALACAILGVALVILAKRITRMVRKSDSVQDNDNVLISLKAIGLILLFVSVLIIVFRV